MVSIGQAEKGKARAEAKGKGIQRKKEKGNVRKIAVRKYYLCVPAVRLLDGNLSFANATN